MSFNAILRKIRKALKVILIVIILLMAGFHFWFVHYAKGVLLNIVEKEGKGKIVLDIDKFSFNWLTRKMSLENVVLATTDTLNAPATYEFDIKRIRINVTAVFPILFKKKISINQLDIEEPKITITKYNEKPESNTPSLLTKDENSLLTEEIGKVYESIQNAIKKLEIKNLFLNNASFTLINKLKPEQNPVHISHFDFSIENLKVDTTSLENSEKIFFSDNIRLRSKNQQILLPNGRHQISFKEFRLDLANQLISFDSCTIAAAKSEKSPTSFLVFFDKLSLKNIDFDSLYRADVIKADSINCYNPKIFVQVDQDAPRNKKQKAPSLEQIISEFTGSLDVKHIAFYNADIDIETIKNKKPNNFTANGNSFEIEGLKIDDTESQNVSVENIRMAIRNYETYLKDSIYLMQFDSLLIHNQNIYLLNFRFQELKGAGRGNQFTIPGFELVGFSWDEFLFNQSLLAQQVTMHYPQIHYIQTNKPKQTGNKKFFDMLASANKSFSLPNVTIYDGDIFLKLQNNIELDLKNATVSIASDDFLKANQISQMRKSVKALQIHTGDILIQNSLINFRNVQFNREQNRIGIEEISLKNLNNATNAHLYNVSLDRLQMNEATGEVHADNIRWNKANLYLIDPKTATGKNRKGFIKLTNIFGKNTSITFQTGGHEMKSHINQLSLKRFEQKDASTPLIEGLQLNATKNSFTSSGTTVSADQILFDDLKIAQLKNVNIHQAGSDTLDAIIPLVNFIPNLHTLLINKPIANNIVVEQPTIRWSNYQKEIIDSMEAKREIKFPFFQSNAITIHSPDLHLTSPTDSSRFYFSWKRDSSYTNELTLKNVLATNEKITIGNVDWQMNQFSFFNPLPYYWNTEKAKLNTSIENIQLRAADNNLQWQALLKKVNATDLVLDSLLKNTEGLEIEELHFTNLFLRDSLTKSALAFVEANKDFTLEKLNAKFKNQTHQFSVQNLRYQHNQRNVKLDSFSFVPTITAKEYMDLKKFQTDYMQVKTAAVSIEGLDWQRLIKDSVVAFKKLLIDSGSLQTLRDKRYPFQHGIIKPLFSDLIAKVPLKIQVDSLIATDAYVEYNETNAKTGETGSIPIHNMQAVFSPIKNFNLQPTDTLFVRATADLFDTIATTLHINESYFDSLSGFKLYAKLNGTELTVLNDALDPLVNARIRTGEMDSLVMYVTGNDRIAYGKQTLYYKKLRADILKANSSTPEKRPRVFLSWLANTFVIKNKNTGKTHTLFFERDRERSIFNYLVKITLEGAKTNTTTLFTSKRSKKKYKKALQSLQILPLE